jgi:hypothetical protein
MAAAACSGDAGEDSGGAGLLARRAQVATAPGSSVDVIAVIFGSFVASVQHAGLEDGGARDLGRILLGLVPLAACGSMRPRLSRRLVFVPRPKPSALTLPCCQTKDSLRPHNFGDGRTQRKSAAAVAGMADDGLNGLGDYCEPDRLASVDNKHAFVWRDFSFVRPGRLKPTGKVA